MFYCVDPGISGTGLACFSGKKLLWWDIVTPKGKDFQEKSNRIIRELAVTIASYATVFCEYPSYQTVAAQNTGSIIKLAFLIGGICEAFNVTLIPVIKWKGQLSKEITQKRAEKFFSKKGFKSHAADAVALGAYVIKENLI